MSFTPNDFPGAATTGFPSPAQDYHKAPLDLASLFVTNRTATFPFLAEGDGMRGVGIWSGDPLVVDRSVQARPGCIVVALVEGGFVVRRLVRLASGFALEEDPPSHPPIPITDDLDAVIWGVATDSVRRLYPR